MTTASKPNRKERRARGKAPRGMPPELAKGMGLKQKGRPLRTPKRARSDNPLQYLLERAAETKGVSLTAHETQVLAAAFMDTREWATQLAAKLAAANAQQNEIVTRLEENDIQAIRSLLLVDDDEEGDDVEEEDA